LYDFHRSTGTKRIHYHCIDQLLTKDNELYKLQRKGTGVNMIKLASLLVLTVGLASAATISFTTPTGSQSAADGLVDASATVVTGAGSVTVTLNDLLGNPHSVGQLLSDFFFTLSSAPTTALNTTSTPTGSLIDIAGDGTATTYAGAVTNWDLTSSGATILLNSLNGSGPSQTIIGPAGPLGLYTNANKSIAGNGPHNPFLTGPVTFTFLVGGVTTSTTVTAATFSFGTAAGDNVPGTPCTDCGGTVEDIPEPLSLFLMGGGLLGVGVLGKFRRA
jgi:hypothetical protein